MQPARERDPARAKMHPRPGVQPASECNPPEGYRPRASAALPGGNGTWSVVRR